MPKSFREIDYSGEQGIRGSEIRELAFGETTFRDTQHKHLDGVAYDFHSSFLICSSFFTLSTIEEALLCTTFPNFL